MRGIERSTVGRSSPSGDGTNYVEHWVLFPGYVYPSAKNGVVTELHVVPHALSGEEEFLATVDFGEGYRYVRVECHDTTSIPGR